MHRIQAFLAPLHLKADRVILPNLIDCARYVHKDIFTPTVGFDEAEAFALIEKLYRSCCHHYMCVSSPPKNGTRRQIAKSAKTIVARWLHRSWVEGQVLAYDHSQLTGRTSRYDLVDYVGQQAAGPAAVPFQPRLTPPRLPDPSIDGYWWIGLRYGD